LSRSRATAHKAGEDGGSGKEVSTNRHGEKLSEWRLMSL
jgi:hypothetical protein